MSEAYDQYRIADVTVNHNARRRPVKSIDRSQGEYPYYGASGIIDSIDGYTHEGKYLLVAEDGENLRTRSTPIAFLADGRFWVNNHAHVIAGNDRARTEYLAYFIENSDVSGYLTGSTQPKLTRTALDSIAVTLPPKTIQDAVVDVISAIDSKIESSKRVADSCDALSRAEITEALMSSSESIALASVASITRGVTPRYTEDDDGLIVLNQKCVRDDRISMRPARRTLKTKVPVGKLLKTNDVLINSTGMGTLGRAARWTLTENATVDSHVSIVRFDDFKIDPICAGYTLLLMQDQIELLGEGSTGQTELSREQLGRLRIPCIAPSVAAATATRLSSLTAVSSHHQETCRALAELRATLLPRLLTGQLTVSNSNEKVENIIETLR